MKDVRYHSSGNFLKFVNFNTSSLQERRTGFAAALAVLITEASQKPVTRVWSSFGDVRPECLWLSDIELLLVALTSHVGGLHPLKNDNGRLWQSRVSDELSTIDSSACVDLPGDFGKDLDMAIA
ncbi:hypothetical protein Tco_0682056 [Tanacetum coccineum]|uniref:Uncharacterized protein n=1 Tax=Tanacetum coccineum TaxID=301880 RepID=A0ABQ4XR33_9ASTR